MALRDIALTVREVAPGEFIWLLLDGAGARAGVLSCELRQSSPTRYASYSSALAAGVAAWQRQLAPAAQASAKATHTPSRAKPRLSDWDLKTLEASQRYFRVTHGAVSVGPGMHHVAIVEPLRASRFTDDHKYLAHCIRTLYIQGQEGAHEEATTVWLKLPHDMAEWPGYITPALQRLAGAGLGVVITQGRKSSHNALLQGDFVAALQAVEHDGYIWDPISGKLMFASMLPPAQD